MPPAVDIKHPLVSSVPTRVGLLWLAQIGFLAWMAGLISYLLLSEWLSGGHSVGHKQDCETFLNIRVLYGAGIYHLAQARHSSVAEGCVRAFSMTCRLTCSKWLTNHFPGQ